MISARRGFSLSELLIVIVIVSIMATLTLVHLGRGKEQMADKEAVNNLVLLSSGQQDYRLDKDVYLDSSDQVAIRRELRVMISTNADRLWTYTAKSSGCVQAARTDGSRSWSLTIDDADGKPNTGACP